MLRTTVLLFACAAIALGAYLCATGVAHGGVQTLVGGAVILVGTLFERWRYRNRNAAAAGGNWQPTGERFVDPGTGRNVEVLYDSRTGERRYQTTTPGDERPH